MSFSATGLAVKNQRPPLGDEVGSQVGTEQRLPKRGLQSEIELINRLQEGKLRLAGKALEPGLFAMCYLFGQQKSQEVAITPVLLLSSIRHVLVNAARVRQIQPAKQGLQLPFRELRDLRPILAVKIVAHDCPPIWI